jgi:hypothetical protein
MIIVHLKSYLNVDPLDVGLFLHNINTLLKCVKYLHQHFTVKSIYKLNARHLLPNVTNPPTLQTVNNIMMVPVE